MIPEEEINNLAQERGWNIVAMNDLVFRWIAMDEDRAQSLLEFLRECQ